jgi:hypothetical protein
MTLDPQQGMPSVSPGQMRAAAVDKERAVDVLKAGFAEGRLTKEEYEDRVGQAYTSRSYAELARITADLPSGPLGALSPRPQTPPSPPPYYPVVPARQRTNGMAIASLVCALLPGIPGFVAIALGLAARRQIRERGDSGVGLANAGIALGGLFTLVIVIFVLTRL